MKEQFVPYEIALKLNEKGFNEECLGLYNLTVMYDSKISQPGEWFKITGPIKNHNEIDFVKAPLWQQVIDWFREKHDIDVMIKQIKLDGTAYYKITKIETEDKIKGYSDFCKSTYEAKEKAIKQALKDLGHE